MRKIILLESPYRGDRKRNVLYARRSMLDSIERHEAPIVPHLLYTIVLDDAIEEQRMLGLRMGDEFLDIVDLVVFYTDYGITPGMQHRLNKALAIDSLSIQYRKIGLNK